MRAGTWQGRRSVSVESVPHPRIEEAPQACYMFQAQADGMVKILLAP
ncbi:hypothetical protein HT102_08185 [Hoyosella sp. G463]|uniref:Uncharacterized protein n=1 Tax=Lolliginicoccus lacisalsi TaxID=2742202 RepID=A0A927JCT0_9ACTN|nr:hypothetical protein [Lolliginicoccus lacisalsi]